MESFHQNAVEFKEMCSDKRADLAQNEAQMHTSEISENSWWNCRCFSEIVHYDIIQLCGKQKVKTSFNLF